jgi:ligand-binding sensor domain-containing protein
MVSRAQDPWFKRFRVEDGLPSNEVYGIAFDQEKILWATTERGIWRYDGYQYRQFSVSDGLKENTNFRMFMDHRKNRIWFSTINNYLHQVINDSVTIPPAGEQVHLLGKAVMHVQHVRETDDGSLLLCYNRPGLYRFSGDSAPERLTGHIPGHEGASVCVFLDSTGFHWDQIGFPDTSQTIKTKVYPENNRVYITSGFKTVSNNFRKELSRIGPDEFLFSYVHKVFHIRNGKLISETSFDKDILSIYADTTKGDFWVGLFDGGAQVFKGGDLRSKPVQYLAGESVTGITRDHEGNYWFSTTTSGIFMTSSFGLSVYLPSVTADKDNMISALESDGENLYLGTQAGNIYKALPEVSGYYTLREFRPETSSTGEVRKIYFTPSRHLMIFREDLLETDLLGRPAGVKIIKTYPYDYSALRQDRWLVSTSNSINHYRKDVLIGKLDAASIQDLLPGDSLLWNAFRKVRTLYYDSSQRLWVGPQDYGVFSVDSTNIHYWGETDTLLGRRARDIVVAGQNTWISLADYGIAIIRPDSTVLRITQKNGLSSDIVDVLFPESDTVIWAGTNKGVNRIIINPDADSVISIQPYTMREGLPSNRIFQIMRHKGNIWLGTTQGAVCIDPEFTMPLKIIPSLVFDTIYVNGNNRNLKDHAVLRADDNNLVFKFKTISYRIPHDIIYRYYLKGIDRDSIITRNLEARYPDLPYGTFTFYVNASYTNDFNPVSEQSVTFTIKKHWFETTLFRFLLGLAGLAAILAGFKYMLKGIKNRERQKQRLLEAEKRSLLSQMNPHFIFNSLNSIQHFIVQRDEYQANNYLTNFSSLIRRILENSKKNLISLNEEITTLTLYLEMEKLRFEDRFEYHIIRDQNIDYMDTTIPPMMLQPFVENAIWHGLMPLESKGVLTITFSRIDGFFHCLICDNGIGREKAARLKGKKEPHASTGMKNVSDRINLLNQLNKKKIELNINDLKNPDGTAGGTLIELIIPLTWD